MQKTHEYLDLTTMAEALGMPIEQLKKEMRLEKMRDLIEETRYMRSITPNASIGGRPYMFWDTAFHFLRSF